MSQDVEIIQLIRTRLRTRGAGKTEEDPIRIIEQYWTMEGHLFLEFDIHTGKAEYRGNQNWI